jgi:hypothetical protein
VTDATGGIEDRGKREEDGPETWESPCSPRADGNEEDPAPNSPALARQRVRAPEEQEKSPPRGRPNARGTTAPAEGARVSEDCELAVKPGNDDTGPGGAKAVRVGVNFRRETWSMQ